MPPFEYLLSMLPAICPRLYSIASSPLYREDKLDLLIVLNEWRDINKNRRVGLTTNFLFGAKPGLKVAIQIRRGILQPPEDTESPTLMFGLGTVSLSVLCLMAGSRPLNFVLSSFDSSFSLAGSRTISWILAASTRPTKSRRQTGPRGLVRWLSSRES